MFRCVSPTRIHGGLQVQIHSGWQDTNFVLVERERRNTPSHSLRLSPGEVSGTGTTASARGKSILQHNDPTNLALLSGTGTPSGTPGPRSTLKLSSGSEPQAESRSARLGSRGPGRLNLKFNFKPDSELTRSSSSPRSRASGLNLSTLNLNDPSLTLTRNLKTNLK